MAQKRSIDAWNSLLLVIAAGGATAFFVFGPRYLPVSDGPSWKNISLWSPSYDIATLLFVMVVGQVNNAPGRPPRIWLSLLMLVAGLAGLFLVVSRVPALIARFGVIANVMALTGGMVFVTALWDGVPAQVWRNLFSQNLDYAGRFFPLAGALICCALLGVWAWDIEKRWMAHDYTSVTDIAGFAVGGLCGLVAGKRKPTRGVSAAIA